MVDLLDSDTLSCGIVGGSANDTIGALSQLFGYIVPLIDNKLLVEDLEHFAALKIRHGGGVAAARGVWGPGFRGVKLVERSSRL